MSKRRISLSAPGTHINDLPAIIEGDFSLSYLQYHRLVASVVEKLKNEGIMPNQHVGIVADNSTGYVITLMALLHLGAVACPVSTRYPSGTIEKTLRGIDCGVVVALEPYVFDSPSIRWIPIFDPRAVKGMGTNPGEIDMDKDATILFTSGTATVPKAVLHSYGNHYYSALGSNHNIALKPGDRWLLSLPLYHVGGLGIVFRCLLSGATIVIGNQGQSIANAIGQYDVTHVSLVPTQLQSLLDELAQGTAPPTLKGVLIGGGFVPKHLAEKAIVKGLPVHTTYGSTEMASQVTTTAPGESADKLCTAGKVLKYRELKLSDDGEILVKGKTLFKAYVASSGLVPPFNSDGWFATGDLGSIDADGYLTVTGRKDNMFISGGENIYPEEIEAAMILIDGVEDVMVVPIDDTQYGQRPVAFVKLRVKSQLTPKQLQGQLLTRLPKFKIPEAILSWPDDIPQTGIKPDRAHFKELVKKSDR